MRDWLHGTFTGKFDGPDQLQENVTKALHNWELSQAWGKTDSDELVRRADDLLKHEPSRPYGSAPPELLLGIALAPRQTVLRPSVLESPSLSRQLNQQAVFGTVPIFSSEEGVKRALEDDALVLRQQDAFFRVDGEGSISLMLPITVPRGSLPIIIEEEVKDTLEKALIFSAEILDSIDGQHRLSQVAVAAKLLGGSYITWRTRRENEANPNSFTLSSGLGRKDSIAHLSPPDFPRATLRHRCVQLSEDLLVLLRRPFRT